MNKLRKKLMKDMKFYPFNDNYDFKHIFNFCKDLVGDENFHPEINTALVSEYMNDIYKESYKYLEKNIVDSNLSYHEIIEFLISSLNRNYILIGKKTELKGTVNSYEDFFRKKINSMDPSIGQIDARAALETEIDSFNIIINYLKYFKEKLQVKKNDVDELHSVDSIIRLCMIATYYYTIKTTYDDNIWNNGFAIKDQENQKIHFKYFDEEKLFLGKIGFFRLHRNVFSHFMVLKELFDKQKSISDFIPKTYNYKINAKRIKSVSLNNGFVNYKKASGYDRGDLYGFAFLNIQILTYYEFIYDVTLPNFKDLTLKDLLILFSVLQSLFRKSTYVSDDDDSVVKLKEFGKFPYKIECIELEKYLMTRTKFNIDQIRCFLNLITNKIDERINFWDYPLFKIKNTYLLPLLTTLDPLIFVLSDKWLEEGGFDLELRGVFFEKFIKEKLNDALTNKKYFFRIPEKSKYKRSDEIWEEIDLIINLKSVCIIAEIKCIRYSLNPRDEHNAISRLTDGVNQVIRKSNFIAENSGLFLDDIGNIEGKEIISIVLTNFPSYSGFIINDIPIVDLYLLESYIRSGRISNYKMTNMDGKTIESSLVGEEIFYNNEDQFCANFSEFLKKPRYITKCKDYFEFLSSKISLEGDYDMFVDCVEFKA